jgi:hypothetical protein
VLDVGLDLSRRRVDVCLICDQGELIGHFQVPADRDGLYGLTRRVAVYEQPVGGVVESMNGARFVHDELVAHGWEVLIADAQPVKGLAPLACKTDKIDARVLAELSVRDLVPAIWLPTPELRRERATPACARASNNPATPTAAARCPSTGPVPALGTDGGRNPRRRPPALPRALPAHQTSPRPPARRQGRPDRPRQKE